MVQSRFCLYILFLLAWTYSCTNESVVNQANGLYVSSQKSFVQNYDKEHLFAHFPKSVDKNSIKLSFSPPDLNCNKQTGVYYLISPLSTGQVLLDSLKRENPWYDYPNEFVVNAGELKAPIFIKKWCNVFSETDLPIPYFNSFDFQLGFKEDSLTVDGEVYYDYTYNVPKDLRTIVLEANSGNYWKSKCNEHRPEEMRNWKNGFSRGISISKKNKIIVYWIIAW